MKEQLSVVRWKRVSNALQEWDMSMGELTFKKAQREVGVVAVQGRLF
jgi:hypothetical protein